MVVYLLSECVQCFVLLKSIQTIWDRRNVSLETPPLELHFSNHRMDIYTIPVSQVPFLIETDSLV